MKKILTILTIALSVACTNDSKPEETTKNNSNNTVGNKTEEIPSVSSLPNNTNDEVNEKAIKIKNSKTPISSEKEGTRKATTPKIQNIQSQTEKEPESTGIVMPKVDFSDVFGQILSKYVSASGKVNYAGIKSNSQWLDQAIIHYQENTPESNWSSNKKLAYWINAYNLFTLKIVVDNYPTTSIKNIANGKPWDKDFIKLDGKTLSLNDIENGIIRKQFNEPRIHFAVNCASISCPKLLNVEYTASNLNSLLEKQTKRFINDTSENEISTNSVKISNIFDWYKVDFVDGIIPFLNKYSDKPISNDAKITYNDYNWNLNN